MDVHGLLLAAGAGRRYGGPKALVPGWLEATVAVLADGGCTAVTVVLGAAVDGVAVPAGAGVVVAEDWALGMGASLRAGLRALPPTPLGAVVHLVDLPDVGAEVVRRLLAEPVEGSSLRRAAYQGVPGHPVLLGRDHWAGVAESSTGDRGARDYLRRHRPRLVECGDLATGADVDRPEPHQRPTGDQPGAE
ncbi:MAG: nucleotidyltransferase family protein [Marmoricola sp.]